MSLDQVFKKKCPFCGEEQEISKIKANGGKCTAEKCGEVIFKVEGAMTYAFVYLIHYKANESEQIDENVYAGTPAGRDAARHHVGRLVKKHQDEMDVQLKPSRLRDYWRNVDETIWIKILPHKIIGKSIVKKKKEGT